MKKKKYSDITITEIVKNADLTRAAFYNNFKSKEDILAAHVHSIWEEHLYNKLENGENISPYDVFLIALEASEKNREFALLLKKNKLEYLFQKEFDANHQNLIPYINKSVKTEDIDRDNFGHYASLFATGYFNILFDWLDKEDTERETPEYMATLMVNLKIQD
jgi:AcrR family transcriptional regulator